MGPPCSHAKSDLPSDTQTATDTELETVRRTSNLDDTQAAAQIRIQCILVSHILRNDKTHCEGCLRLT